MVCDILNNKKLPGNPDIVLPKYRTVTFVNGCFWHGHECCKYFVVLKTKTDWWLNRIFKTKNGDIKAKNELENLCWKVIIIGGMLNQTRFKKFT
jgi:DNA mismatch endonuclease, patch repair protein